MPAVWHWSGVAQVTGLAPVQMPAWQLSVCVQRLASLQELPSALAGLEQAPVEGLQVPAVWHWSAAAQVTGLPPVHEPPGRCRTVVQALPSLQGAVLAVWAQVPAPLQTSSVQTLPSVLQAVAAAVKQLSAASLQELLHSAPPAQGSPAWLQVPPPQVSAPLQKRPSSQGAVLLVWAQVPVPLQASSVQTLPSVVQAVAAATKQLSAASLQELLHSAPPAQGSPAWPQVPPPQVSAPLQKRPSSQGAVLLVWAQVPAPLQKSSVQTLLSVAQAVAVELKQLSAASLQELLHAAPPVQGIAHVRRAGARRAAVGAVAERPVVAGRPVVEVDGAARLAGARVGGVRVALLALVAARARDRRGRGAADAVLAGLAGRAGVAVIAGGAVRELHEGAVGLPDLAAVARDRVGDRAGVGPVDGRRSRVVGLDGVELGRRRVGVLEAARDDHLAVLEQGDGGVVTGVGQRSGGVRPGAGDRIVQLRPRQRRPAGAVVAADREDPPGRAG